MGKWLTRKLPTVSAVAVRRDVLFKGSTVNPFQWQKETVYYPLKMKREVGLWMLVSEANGKAAN